MSDRALKYLSFFLPVLISAAGLLILLVDPYALQGMRNGLFDQFTRAHACRHVRCLGHGRRLGRVKSM